MSQLAIACADSTGAELGVDRPAGTSVVNAERALVAPVGAGSAAYPDIDPITSRNQQQTALAHLRGESRPDLDLTTTSKREKD